MPVALWLSASLLLAGPELSVTAVDSRPAPRRPAELEHELAELREQVSESPRERGPRLALVRTLADAGQLEQALDAAREWRKVDAYNLVVVRLIGDLLSELGRDAEALRSYSAVTELLPEDPEAQRALATVLETRGELDAAAERLAVAVALRPEDPRLAFELADVDLRRGRHEQAAARLEAIVAEPSVPEELLYPSKQRLSQVYAQRRRSASSDAARAEWTAKIDALALDGGSENDIKIYLSWDSDRTDVDLSVINPAGERVFYQHKRGRFGGQLYRDVTGGYGPESFTAATARAGTYKVEVHYYGGSPMKEARGEVLIVLNEGRESEEQYLFPYVLPRVRDRVRVAEIKVVTGEGDQ